MKASEASLINLLKQTTQFVIPIYQRTYSWTEKECRQLWDDIVRAGSDERIKVHFMGSIVYIEQGQSQSTNQSPLLVIDGQQRVTSVSLLLAALAKIVSDGEPFDGFSRKKISHYYLTNPLEEGDRFFKLLLSQTDKETLTSIVGETPVPENHSIRIIENYNHFTNWLSHSNTSLEVVCRGISKLMVVDVALTRGQDNPQLIFESMNSTGKELSQADLIRNFILMGLEPELQTKLYKQYWHPMEKLFGQEAYGTHFDSFMRHYLTLKTTSIPRKDEVYEAYKEHASVSRLSATGDDVHVETLVRELYCYAQHFCAMALGKEQNPQLSKAFNDIRELRVDVAYPFLLELYHDYSEGHLSVADFEQTLRLIESYVFRRTVCNIPTNSLNKTFCTFTKSLKKDRYLESIQAHFLLLKSYRRFPKGDEFRREIKVRNLYKFRNCSYWLRRFENFGRKERVIVDDYTIEHIMPQNENLSAQWKKELGDEWERIHETWLHTLGNLTLTGYNSEYSDRPFSEKRDMENGFAQSPLKINEGLSSYAQWDESAIQDRAEKLSYRAVEVWREPELDTSILEQYDTKSSTDTTYSIDDHPYLVSSPMAPVFEQLRSEIVALDDCVTCEFWKLYVAFKAETNFVDIIPQAKRLLLTLNSEFSEISDPKSLCRNITGLGRWGNGNVELSISSTDDIPYAISLIRQTLEKQLGEESEE